MPDTNTPPAGGTGDASPIAEHDAVSALADILDDPATDTVEAPAAKPAGTKPAAEDPLAAVFDDGEEEPESDSIDETSDEAGKAEHRDESGRFVSPNAKVKLPDGTTTTVAELASGHLRQSDYTRKTQELSEHRKEFETERSRAKEIDQQLQTQFAQVNWWLEQTKPQRPQGNPTDDPLAYLEYQRQAEQWTEARNYWAAEQQKVGQARKAAEHDNLQKHLKSESEALFKAVPALRDPGKRDAFVTEAAKLLSPFGIKREEIAGLTDHRMILVVREAVKGLRLLSKTPAVRAELGNKPPIIRGSKRSTPGTQNDQAKRQRTDRLRNEGSVEAGIAALMDMDL